MTDTQNPTPLDGSENPSSEREKTVAELEVEARERAQAQRKESAPVEDVKPDQPEVNSLKKRGKNRLMTLGILLLAALIVLAWMGDWAYNHFMSAPAPKAEQAKTAPDDVSYGRKRQGMGMAENPLGLQDTASTDTTTNLPRAAAPPVSFNKSMALAAMASTQSSGQTATVSRTAERSTTEHSVSPATAQPYTPCTVPLVMDASGKLACPVGAEASPGVAPAVSTVTGVQRMRLDPDLYIPVEVMTPTY